MDASGAIFGTTGGDGSNGQETVCKLTQPGKVFNETILHSFGDNGDGLDPLTGVVEDQNGNLYGTTVLGGSDTVDCGQYGCGTVFEATMDGSG